MSRVAATPTQPPGGQGSMPPTPTTTVVPGQPQQQPVAAAQPNMTATMANGAPKGPFRGQAPVNSPPSSTASPVNYHASQAGGGSGGGGPPQQQQQQQQQQPQPQTTPGQTQPLMSAATGATPLTSGIPPYSMASSNTMQPTQNFNGQPFPIYVSNCLLNRKTPLQTFTYFLSFFLCRRCLRDRSIRQLPTPACFKHTDGTPATPA